MSDEIIKPEEWISSKELFRVPKALEPQVDEVISRIVSRKIYQRDPRLIKLIVKWKKGKSQDSMEPDNFLDDPRKVAELKKVLSGNL